MLLFVIFFIALAAVAYCTACDAHSKNYSSPYHDPANKEVEDSDTHKAIDQGAKGAAHILLKIFFG